MPKRSAVVAQSLQTLLTRERLAPYVSVAGGDLDLALDLYEWNGRVGAAVFEDFGYLEVLLRNACDERLREWNRRQDTTIPWYLHSVFGPASRLDIDKARHRAVRGGRPELPGRVVAELMFGFWRFLHARSYEASLWTPCLRLAYPHLQPQRRRTVYARLDRLNTLRNRIAHHEPIHRADVGGTGKTIAELHGELTEVIEWIDPAVAGWVRSRSAVPGLLHARPLWVSADTPKPRRPL
ncbi:hypothetical protein DW322_02595 [Rhodococcus rhodnii]|uniref:Abi-like protein n=2 Tax=Rhodococcus rhodnii TaxID=38312 RepID=R7WQV8_9NOCA|nr:hypothetical protein [Rhodococcus rhodnii]EOM77711.1 hypothetical protein Rrhod_0954 [Rhodococcus rhodnii LMG 5362]TXG89331.1 hypothetical protein DW322_02595 [Rhodococcus rhodnii]